MDFEKEAWDMLVKQVNNLADRVAAIEKKIYYMGGGIAVITVVINIVLKVWK